MKKFVIGLMVIQVLLLGVGIYQLIDGKLIFGLFNVVLNSIFFMVNLDTLKEINR